MSYTFIIIELYTIYSTESVSFFMVWTLKHIHIHTWNVSPFRPELKTQVRTHWNLNDELKKLKGKGSDISRQKLETEWSTDTPI